MDQALGPRDKGVKRFGRGGYIVLTFVALITGVSMFYLSNVSLKEMFMTRHWKANDDCLIQYESKVVSTLAHIMAEQVAKGRRAIKTTPRDDYLWLAKKILVFIESHDIGDKVQEKTTIHPEFEGGKGITRRRSQPELAESAPASTSTCELAGVLAASSGGVTNASGDTFEHRCYCKVNHSRRGCYYNKGNSGGSALSDDKQEQPQPGLAEGPRQPRELQKGPPTSRERPNKGPDEDLEQLKQLQQGGTRVLHHWQSNWTDVPVKPL